MPPGEGDSGLERDLPPQAKKNVFSRTMPET